MWNTEKIRREKLARDLRIDPALLGGMEDNAKEYAESICGSKCAELMWDATPATHFSRVTRQEILSLSQSNSVLSQFLAVWQHGVYTWEQAMTEAAAYLAKQNSRLIGENEKLLALKVPDPMEIEGKLFVYSGPCPSCGQPIGPKSTEDAHADA
jgi:hypothetical protein